MTRWGSSTHRHEAGRLCPIRGTARRQLRQPSRRPRCGGERRKLINERGGIDGIAALDELTPKLRENLAGNETSVRNNVEMMVLVRDVELDPGSTT